MAPECFCLVRLKVPLLRCSRKFPTLPQKILDFPGGSSPDFPGGQPFLCEAWHPLMTHKNFVWPKQEQLLSPPIHSGNILVTTTTKTFPKALLYKWKAYYNTNGRCTAMHMGGVLPVFPFPQSVGAPKVPRYELEAYCDTNWQCISIRFWEVVVVLRPGPWGCSRARDIFGTPGPSSEKTTCSFS